MIPKIYNFRVASLYSEHGIGVFPCRAGGENAKAPLVKGGFKVATTDPVQLQNWAHRFPDAAWGAAVPAGVMVLDLDFKTGKNGVETLCAQIGDDALGDLFSKPPIISTPSGGKHIYRRIPVGLEYTNGADVNGMPGIDLRIGGRGYIMLPGTAMESGNYLPEFPYYGNPYCHDIIAMLLVGDALPVLEPALQTLLQKAQRQAEKTSQPGSTNPVDFLKAADALGFLADVLPDCERSGYDSWRNHVLFPLSHGVRTWDWPEGEAKRVYNEISAIWGGDTANNEAQWQAALCSDPDTPITVLSALKKAHEYGWRWTFARMINTGGGI